MRALVTGATGFIGSHLAERLAAGPHEVHVLVRQSSDLGVLAALGPVISVHITDGSFDSLNAVIQLVSPEIVFHAASLFLSEHRPEDVAALVQSNILFPCQLVEAMVRNGVRRLVNCGTSWQHYQGKQYSPVCLYAATKQAFSDLLQYYVEATELAVVTLTLFDTYGPDDKRLKLFSTLYRAAASGETTAFSPGDQLIHIVYIDDVVDALILAAQRLLESPGACFESFAVRTEQPIRLRELVEIFSAVTGLALKIVWGGRPYRSREMMTPWQDGATLPGWSAKVGLQEGIRKVHAEHVRIT
jgi:nucleoside-diphosphate-sugar epimerase